MTTGDESRHPCMKLVGSVNKHCQDMQVSRSFDMDKLCVQALHTDDR